MNRDRLQWVFWLFYFTKYLNYHYCSRKLLHPSCQVEGPRQNFQKESEAGINKQINLEMYSSYFYLGLAYHFDRDDIALAGFHKYFKQLSDEERCDAEKVMGNIFL